MADQELHDEDEAPPSSRDWDADAYHRLSLPQTAWGTRVLASLQLSGDETVLDAGCGTGKLTAALMARLPRGRAIALDASEDMLRVARGTLASFGDRVTFLHADVSALTLPQPCDVVFSTATFHWVKDHVRLFAAIFGALGSGGRLHAQCGGGPNLALIHARANALMSQAPYKEHFHGWEEPTYFSTAEDAAARLSAAGFTAVQTDLRPAPTVLPDRDAYRAFVDKVILTAQLARLPDDATRARFLDEIVDQAEKDETPFLLDYVRLNLQARKP
jgi:trans-aconitate methyltransferase